MIVEKAEDQVAFQEWHKHATEWAKEELEILDAGEDQEMWLALREGLQRWGYIEALNGMQVEEAARAKEVRLATKTISVGEVRGELESWREAAKKEYAALVERKVVKPIARNIEDITGFVEVLPAKAVCTRKSPNEEEGPGSGLREFFGGQGCGEALCRRS